MEYTALISITSFNRLTYLKLFLPDYLAFCKKDNRFNLLISLDGNDQSYIKFCNYFRIPLLYSEKREGVGLSKNRVIETFPDFDYYFFIDDDVELINPAIFTQHINYSLATGIHHFSSGEISRFIGNIRRKKVNNNYLILSDYGSGAFNFFSNEGLKQVGGWHTLFAKYKRWGHTEHSYRFYNNSLAEAPFIAIEELTENYMRWYNPPASPASAVNLTSYQIPDFELDLISRKLTFYPNKTLSIYYFNDFPTSLCNIIFKKYYIFNESLIKKLMKNQFLSERDKKALLSDFTNYFYKNRSLCYAYFAFYLIRYSEGFENSLFHLRNLLVGTIKLIIKNLISYPYQ